MGDFKSSMWCRIDCISSRESFAEPTFKCSYTCTESAEITSPFNRFANEMATPDFPTDVGPEITNTFFFVFSARSFLVVVAPGVDDAKRFTNLCCCCCCCCWSVLLVVPLLSLREDVDGGEPHRRDAQSIVVVVVIIIIISKPLAYIFRRRRLKNVPPAAAAAVAAAAETRISVVYYY